MDYDKAYALARHIKESKEFKTLQELMQKVEEDPSGKRMLEDFRKREMELYAQQMTGQEVSQAEWEKLSRLYETLTLHQDIRALFEAENRFQQVYEDIQRIISEPIQELYDATENSINNMLNKDL